MSSAAQIAANRANAQLSTGPRTVAGKAASSMNSYKLGLACQTFRVLENEDQQDFDHYTSDLAAEYGVETTMERTLLYKIAQHHWLSQRAFICQETCFDDDSLPDSEYAERRLAMALRYQAHHDRAFHKTRNELEKLLAARRKRETVAQPQQPAAPKSVKPPQPQSQPESLPKTTPPAQPAHSEAIPINEAA